MARLEKLQDMDQASLSAAIILIIASGVILSALGFQHIGGHIPCTLCYYERFAYYLAIPLAVLILMGRKMNMLVTVKALLLVIMTAFLLNAALGTYHAGAEWKFWPGPTFCGSTSSLELNAGNLLDKISNIKIVRCDEAGGRFLGLSFAGYNVLASLFLAAIAFRGFQKAASGPKIS